MNNHPLIDQMIQFSPIIIELAMRDTALAVTDLTHYLNYIPGKQLNHRVKAGDSVKAGSLVDMAMKYASKRTAIVDAELFGVPYIGTAIPIVDPSNGKVIGSIFIGESTEKQETLKNMAKELSTNVSEITDSTKNISVKADEFSAFSEALANLTSNFTVKVSQINQITGIIQNISKKSNMLGINAAIESARIGEQGRGFAVVAEEISKLSKQSNASVLSIADMTGSILTDSNHLKTETEILSRLSLEINDILTHLTQNIESIYGMVEELTSLSESL